jgi:hypothetical protein
MTAAALSVWPSSRASGMGTAGRRLSPARVRSLTEVPEASQVVGGDVGADLAHPLPAITKDERPLDELQRLGPGDDLEQDLVSAGLET